MSLFCFFNLVFDRNFITDGKPFPFSSSDYSLFDLNLVQTAGGNSWVLERPTASGNPVPEPTTMLLFGAGLVGLAGFGRKKFKK